jgi:hypothetical protein
LRTTRPIHPGHLTELQDKFADILRGPARLAPGAVPRELNEFPELARLILPFDHRSFGRLRQLIDFINQL